MLNAAVIGATGYTGAELVRLLVQHPQVQLKAVTTQSYGGKNLEDVFPHLRGQLQICCSETDINALSESCDVIFIALPHGAASRMVTVEVLNKSCVIDLGADFRLSAVESYRDWYHTDHGNPALLNEAIYGLPEWHEQAIAKARLIANPGCYATAANLALLPLVKSGIIEPASIVVDGKSGVSGAGRGTTQAVHFNECNETIKAYGVTTHRHIPEIEQQLERHYPGIRITFTPHLVPMNRGILVTAYGAIDRKLVGNITINDVHSVFEECYEHKPFVRLCSPDPENGCMPETRWVKGSNFCDIGYAIDQRTSRVIVVAALDNLVKGAAGQAIQNMNLRFGIDQTVGLTQVPLFPA